MNDILTFEDRDRFPWFYYIIMLSMNFIDSLRNIFDSPFSKKNIGQVSQCPAVPLSPTKTQSLLHHRLLL